MVLSGKRQPGKGLTPEQVKAHVRRILHGDGAVIFTGHVEERMRQREFTTQDIQHVLERGKYSEGHWEAQEGNHEANVSGLGLRGGRARAFHSPRCKAKPSVRGYWKETKPMMICQECGTRMRRRKASREKPYRYVECGLENVFLSGIYLFECPECGEQLPEIPSFVELHDRIGAALVTKPTLLTGPEIRYLRKNLGLKATDFAEFLETTPVSVSRWETDEQPASKENDKLIRYFYVRYKEETTKRRIREVLVEQLRHIEREPRPLTINIKFGPHGMSTEFVEAAAA